MTRSARPAELATKTTVSPAWRAERSSPTQSGTRPENSIAGCVATWRTSSSVPSASVSRLVAPSSIGATSSHDTTSDAGSGACSFFRTFSE